MHEQGASPRAGRLLSGWMRAVASAPRRALAALAVLTGLAAWSAAGLGVDTDSSRMIDPDLPFQARAHALNEAFPALKNTVVVAVRAPTADPADAAVAAITEALDGAPGVAGVFAPSVDPFFTRNGLLYLSPGELDARLTRLTKSANMLAALRADRSLGGFLDALDEATALAGRADTPGGIAGFYAEAAAVFAAAAEGRHRALAWTGALDPGGGETVTRVVSITPELDYARLAPARDAIDSARAAIAGLDPAIAGAVETGLTGEPVLRAEELASVAGTLPLSLALSLLLVAAVLRLALGTAARAGLALGALVVTLVLTAGVAGAAVGALNLVSVAFVVLMTGLGIDFAIHLMAHLEEEADGGPASAALGRTGALIGPALGLSAVSTAAAFLAFTVTDFVGMGQLGLIGGAGVLIAFAVTVTLVPAAVALRPGLAAGKGRRIALPTAERGRAGPLAALAVGLAALVLAPAARFDADPMGLRDPDAPSVRAYDWLAADAALGPLRLSVMTDEDAAPALAARLAALGTVREARWIGDFVPTRQDDKLALIDLAWPSLDFAVNATPAALSSGGEATLGGLAARLRAQGTGAADRLAAALEAYARVRDPARDARLEADLFRYFPLLMDRLSAQLAVDRVTRADLPGAVAARFVAPDGRVRVEAVPGADITDPAAREAFVAEVTAAAPRAAGPPAQIVGAGETIASAMVTASALALAAATLLAWLALRRTALVAAILLPVGLAGAVTLAASVLLGMPFNYANIIVLPLMIGIGVDGAIHLALRAARSESVSATATPAAVAWSALTTIGAFATLALSDHRGTASMGVMLAAALAAAVVMAFALTPPLARLAGRGGRS